LIGQLVDWLIGEMEGIGRHPGHTAASEEQLAIPVGTESIHAVLHHPEGDPAAGVVICPPLLEERKSAQRVLVEMARALAAADVAVMRFDYRGTGDSPGALADFAFAAWREDVGAARTCLSERFPSATMGLLGLRLGASLATVSTVSAGVSAPGFLVLWEPIVSGTAYVNQLFRQMLVKEMMTYGKGRRSRADVVAELENGGSVDADGFLLTSQLYRDIAGLDLTAAAPDAGGPALVLHVGATEEPSRPLAAMASHLRDAGADVTLSGLRMPPIWSLVGFVDYTPVIEKTLDWVRHHVISARHE